MRRATPILAATAVALEGVMVGAQAPPAYAHDHLVPKTGCGGDQYAYWSFHVKTGGSRESRKVEPGPGLLLGRLRSHLSLQKSPWI